MRHLSTITIGAALLVAVSHGPAPSPAATSHAAAGAVDAPVVTTSYVLVGAPATIRAARHKSNPRCPAGTRKLKSRKGYRCVGVGSGGTVITGIGNGTGIVSIPGPTPRIVTFGNGAGSGITTFGQGLGANTRTNAGTGPFGNLGGPSVGR